MRVAVITDTHGNRFALEAVLTDVRAAAPDQILNLGDQVWGSADPAGAYALQRELGALEARGNTDEFIAATDARLNGEWAAVRPSVDRLRDLLPASAVAHLAALPTAIEAADGEIVAAHGSLRDPWDALFRTRDATGTRDATRDELLERARDHARARVIIVGHTHTEKILSHDGRTFVNAGPVSLQADGDPAARWVLLERRGRAWTVSFRRVEYDFDTAARFVLEHDPDGAAHAAQLRAGRLAR